MLLLQSSIRLQQSQEAGIYGDRRIDTSQSDSVGFWLWCIAIWITGLLDFVYSPVFLKTQRFGNWICFSRQVWDRRQLLWWVRQKELPSITGPHLKTETEPVSITLFFFKNTGRWTKSKNSIIQTSQSIGHDKGCIEFTSISVRSN